MTLHGFDKTLLWSDFTAVDASPDPPHSACVKWEILATYEAETEPRTLKWHVTTADVTVGVNKKESWVVKTVLDEADKPKSRALLAHEQQHYNIAAIGARTLHKQLLALKGDKASDPTTAVGALINSFIAPDGKVSAVQSRYDGAIDCGTDHGLKVLNQDIWEHRIAKARGTSGTLAELNTCPPPPDGKTSSRKRR